MTFDQYWMEVESRLGPTSNVDLRLALRHCAMHAWEGAQLVPNLVDAVKVMPEDKLNELATKLVYHDRTKYTLLKAEHDMRHANEEARNNLCSDLHGR